MTEEHGQLEPIQERAYRFALRVIKWVQAMPGDVVGSLLGRQLPKAATSIGANAEEAVAASSRRDFASRMNIALKEARETHYWLRLIEDAGMFDEQRMDPIVQEALEIKMIPSATVKTARRNLNQ